MKKPAPRWYIVETMAHKRAMARPMRLVHIRENAEAKAADYALMHDEAPREEQLLLI